MKTIWKYQLEITDEQEIEIPIIHDVLCFKIQDHKPCIWVSLFDDGAKRKTTFYIVGTGNPMPNEPAKYIGTIQDASNGLVWHLFEKLSQS